MRLVLPLISTSSILLYINVCGMEWNRERNTTPAEQSFSFGKCGLYGNSLLLFSPCFGDRKERAHTEYSGVSYVRPRRCLYYYYPNNNNKQQKHSQRHTMANCVNAKLICNIFDFFSSTFAEGNRSQPGECE